MSSSAAVDHAAGLHDLAAVTLDPNKVSPGLLGFLVVCAIGLATWALARNMAKHLRRHEASRPDELDADESGANQESAVVNARDGEAADKGR